MKIFSFIIVIVSFIFFSACIAAALYPFFKKEEEAENPYSPLACPATGSFIGWKCAVDESNHYVLIKLEIPKDAKRTSGFGSKKCRCDKAKVLEIRNFTGELKEAAHSIYDFTFVYKVGEEVSVKDFCDDRMLICTRGIHFFMEKKDALGYLAI